jgi:hypothetical protein
LLARARAHSFIAVIDLSDIVVQLRESTRRRSS